MGRNCAASWSRGWSREACNDTHKEGFDSGRISVPTGAELKRQAAVRSCDLPAHLGEDGAVGPEPAHPRPLPGAAARAGKRRAVVRGDQRSDGIVLRAGAHSAVRDCECGKRCAGALGGGHDSTQRAAAADPPGTEEVGEVGVAGCELTLPRNGGSTLDNLRMAMRALRMELRVATSAGLYRAGKAPLA